MSTTLLSDSIDASLDRIAEALRQMRPDTRAKAKEAAVLIESVVTTLRKDNPRNPAVALGVVFAIFKLAERFRDADREGASANKSMIQLLQ